MERVSRMSDGFNERWTDLFAYISTPENPETRLLRAQEIMKEIQEIEIVIKDLRRQSMLSLHKDDGWTFQQISELAGISHGRVTQIIRQYEPPSRPGLTEHHIKVSVAKHQLVDPSQKAQAIWGDVYQIKGIRQLPTHMWCSYTGIPEEIWHKILQADI
jgi:hypothetical protein